VINLRLFERAVLLREAEVVHVVDVGNIRLRNQDGISTLQKTNHYSLDALARSKGGKTIEAFAFILPGRKDEIRFALEDLFLMGVNPRSIFPGLSGVAEYIIMKDVFETWK